MNQITLSEELDKKILLVDDLVNKGAIGNDEIKKLQSFLDKVDEQTKNIKLSNIVLAKMYQLQALIYSLSGESQKSDDFIVEAMALIGDSENLSSQHIRKYINARQVNTPKGKIASKDLPWVLSDETKVIKSMKWIQFAGLWTTVTGIIFGLAALIFLFWLPLDVAVVVLLLITPLSSYLIYAGRKLNRLSTGRNTVAFLIVNLAISLLFSGGVITALMLISTIIALIRVDGYIQWWDLNEEYYHYMTDGADD